MFNKEAVCQGYAQLIYKMLKELGVPVRVICGYGGSDVLHGWNIVKLGGYYYNIDATWDAEVWQNIDTYRYFLKGDYFARHTRTADYSTAEFYCKYPMGQNNYGSDIQYDSFNTKKAKYNILKPRFKALSKKRIVFKKVSGSLGYVVQYSADKSLKRGGKTLIIKKNYYKFKKSRKYYVRFRAYTYIDGKKVYTKWSSKKRTK